MDTLTDTFCVIMLSVRTSHAKQVSPSTPPFELVTKQEYMAVIMAAGAVYEYAAGPVVLAKGERGAVTTALSIVHMTDFSIPS
jgi:hypothetical protein